MAVEGEAEVVENEGNYTAVGDEGEGDGEAEAAEDQGKSAAVRGEGEGEGEAAEDQGKSKAVEGEAGEAEGEAIEGEVGEAEGEAGEAEGEKKTEAGEDKEKTRSVEGEEKNVDDMTDSFVNQLLRDITFDDEDGKTFSFGEIGTSKTQGSKYCFNAAMSDGEGSRVEGEKVQKRKSGRKSITRSPRRFVRNVETVKEVDCTSDGDMRNKVVICLSILVTGKSRSQKARSWSLASEQIML